MVDKKIYLGYGAYAEWDGDGILITTLDGERTSNKIYLNPLAWVNLKEWAARIFEADGGERGS